MKTSSKQNKSKKSDNVVGKGKVTPVQVAFIVDRYLSDNNYTRTRSTFRSEVSNLLSTSPVQEAPERLLSLSEILDEYIRLKGQRLSMEQERVQLEQEKMRVHNLLKGMQDVMNDYNQSTSVCLIPPALPSAGSVNPHIDLAASSRAGHYPVYNSSVMTSTSRAWSTHTDGAQFSTPVTNQPKISKRKGSSKFDASIIAKRSRKSTKTNQLPIEGVVEVGTHNHNGCAGQQSIGHGKTSIVPSPQGSTVVKCLFNQSTPSPPANSCPKTPPRSSSSQTEKATSPVLIFPSGTSCEDMTCQQITTNSTMISSQTIRISPVKQISYCSIERNHSISISSPSNKNHSISISSPSKRNHSISISSPSKRNHIKGRLNFDASDIPTSSFKPISDVSTSESDGEAHILDLDLPSLDSLGEDFNLSDLLFDFDLQNNGSDCSGQPTGDSSPDSHSGSLYTALEDGYGANPVPSHISKAKELYSEDTDMPALGCVTTIKSMTKCIKMLSPVKRQMNGSVQQA